MKKPIIIKLELLKNEVDLIRLALMNYTGVQNEKGRAEINTLQEKLWGIERKQL